MKLGLVELSAAAIGIAAVVGLHLNDARTQGADRRAGTTQPEPVSLDLQAAVLQEQPTVLSSIRQAPDPDKARSPEPLGESLYSAELTWEAASNELAAVEAELAHLDKDLSDLADRYAVRETEGGDPDALEADRSHQYDELVNRYEALQQQAAALEEAEYRAAAQLEELLEARSD